MIRNLSRDLIQICLIFVISYISLIVIILLTSPRYIALAFINPTLLLATTVVLFRQAKQPSMRLGGDFFYFGFLYSLLTAALWWLVITLYFTITGGNRFLDIIWPSLPEFAYSFAAIFICCLVTYLLLNQAMSDATKHRRGTNLLAIGSYSVLTIGIAVLMLWVISAIIAALA